MSILSDIAPISTMAQTNSNAGYQGYFPPLPVVPQYQQNVGNHFWGQTFDTIVDHWYETNTRNIRELEDAIVAARLNLPSIGEEAPEWLAAPDPEELMARHGETTEF